MVMRTRKNGARAEAIQTSVDLNMTSSPRKKGQGKTGSVVSSKELRDSHIEDLEAQSTPSPTKVSYAVPRIATIPLYDFDVRIETNTSASPKIPAFHLLDERIAIRVLQLWFPDSTSTMNGPSPQEATKLETTEDQNVPLTSSKTSTASQRGKHTKLNRDGGTDEEGSQRAFLRVEFVPQVIDLDELGLDVPASSSATVFAYNVNIFAPKSEYDDAEEEDEWIPLGYLIPSGIKDAGHPLSRMDPRLLESEWIQMYGEVILARPFLLPPKDEADKATDSASQDKSGPDPPIPRTLGFLSVQVGLEPIALQYGAFDEAVDGFVDTNLDIKKTSVEGTLGLARAMKVALAAIVDWKGSLLKIDTEQHTYWDRNASFYDLPPKQNTLSKHRRLESAIAVDSLSSSPTKRKRKPHASNVVQRVYHDDADFGTEVRPVVKPKVAALPLGEVVKYNELGDTSKDTFLPLDTNIASLLEACRPPTNLPTLYPPSDLIPTPLMRYQARCLHWMINRETVRDEDADQLMPNWVPLQTKPKQEIFLMRKRLELEREAVFDSVSSGRPVQRKKINQQISALTEQLEKTEDTKAMLGDKSFSLRREPFIDSVNVKFHYDQVSGMLSLRRFTCRPSEPGGALCESMGLGKTLEVLALIATRPRPTSDNLLSYDHSRSAKMIMKLEPEVRPIVSRATLVVCPAALVEQWLDEIRTHFRSSSSIPINTSQQPGIIRYRHDDFAWDASYSRNQVRAMAQDRLATPDIVVATYEELATQLAESHKVQLKNLDVRTPLLEVLFWRIVLDEAQIVAGASGRATQMVHELWRSNCWMVTGTPVTKGIRDIQGIFAFLDHDPFASPRFFKDVVQDPFVRGEVEGIRRLRAILPRYVWRHTKAHVENEIVLPPSHSEILEIELKQLERLFYDREVKRYRSEYAKKAGNGVKEIGQTDFLVNLRQLLSHPQIADQLKFGGGLSRMSFVELFRQFCQKAESELDSERMQVVTCLLQLVWGHDYYDEEQNKKRWLGGKRTFKNKKEICSALELGMAIANNALKQRQQQEDAFLTESERQTDLARESLQEPASALASAEENGSARDTSAIEDKIDKTDSPQIPTETEYRALGVVDTTRLNLVWEEAQYWLRLLLYKYRAKSVGTPPSEPSVRWDPERPVRTFFEKVFKSVNDKSVDLEDARFHLVVQDAGTEDMDEDELMAQIEASRVGLGGSSSNLDPDQQLDTEARPTKKHKALEPGLLKKSRLRGGASQRKQARVWFYKPKERLDHTLSRLERAKASLETKEHEAAFLREKLNEVQLASRTLTSESSSGARSQVECLICFDVKVQVGILPCYHAFCIDCIEAICRHRGQGKCPSCRQLFNAKSVTRIVQEQRHASTDDSGFVVGDWGAKISGLITDLKAKLKADSTHKAVIFSHWKKMLAFSRDALVQNGIPTVVFGGGEEGQAAALKAIRDDLNIKVILVPFRASAGAAGLTLTSCDLAYLMEPALDAALEAQAIGRIHRIGQLRPTRVIRVKVKDTVEDTVMRIAEQRSQKGMQMALRLPADPEPGTDAEISTSQTDTGAELSLRAQSIAASLGSSVGVARDSDATRLSIEEVAMILDFDIEAEKRATEEQRRPRWHSRPLSMQMGFELVNPSATVPMPDSGSDSHLNAH